MTNRIRFQMHALFSLILLGLLASAALADVTGSILGVVHDSTQAVVAGARIVATNAQTNFKQETVSGPDGSFHILALPAGVYKLTVTAAGFSTFTETNVEVKVNDQLHFDVVLKIGSVQEQVEIVANAVQVQTESSQLGDVIDSKKMLALPLNGRSYIDLLGLQAGVAPDTSGTIGGDRQVSGNLNAGNISVNGQRETANAFLVNGGDVSEGRNLGAGMVPNLDSIEEFRLITNSFDAEYGKFSGAVVNAITKSGTNGIHGDVFEFLRNDKLDANGYFANAAGLPRTKLQRNQFGYAVGGPFWKNKLFWFTDYQGTREVQGAETFAFLPTADQRQGNFGPGTLTGTVDGAYWAQVLTQRLGYTVKGPDPSVSYLGEPYWVSGCNTLADAQAQTCVFPGGVITPPGPGVMSAWSPVAVKTFSYIPAPNVDPAVGSYSDNSQKNRVSDNKYGQRVDFNNQTTGNWSWYYHYDYSSVFSPLPAASVPGFPSLTLNRAQQFVMSNTKNLGATAVNEARISVFRNRLNKDNPKGSFAKLSDLGFNNANGLGIIPSTTPGYPEFMPQMYFNNFFIGVPTLNTFQPNTTYTASDGFSKAMGRHTLKFGGEARYLQVNERNYASPNGNFVFDGSVTGSDFADYLLGAPADVNGYTQAALQLLDSRTRYGGAYVQDTWKAKSNLTLNLGLRWEVSMPWYDTQGKIQAIVPGLQSTVFPLSPPGLNFPGDPGIPKTIAPTRYNNFGPRLGLAYSPGFSEGALGKIFGGPGKTSIRAAFGLYYTSIEDLNLFYEVADAPFGLYWSTPVPVMLDEPFRIRTSGQSLGQRFPFTLPTPGAASNKTLDFSIYEPFTYYPGYDIHNKLPYAEHFNLSIQRQLSKSTVLTLAYVGTEGHHLITSLEANPGDPGLCLQLATEGCGPYAENNVFQLLTATGSCETGTSTPNPQCVYSTRHTILNPNYCPGNVTLVCFGYGNTYTRLNANSIYNSGQITVERKANDVTFLAAYTFARGLDNSSGFGDYVNFSNAKLSRGLSSTDITHNFVVSYIWAVPFDRAFKGAPKRLTQGWQIQGITRLATGFPIQMSQGNGDISLTGSPSGDMPNLIGKVVTFDPRKATPGCPTNITNDGTGCYFLPPLDPQDSSQCGVPGGPPESQAPSGGAFNYNCAFGTFGTANRRFFHGPGFNNTDFGLMKRTNIREGMGFELRAEFFNIFNHAQFINPNGNISDYQSFGIITSARAPRIGQVSAKFFW